MVDRYLFDEQKERRHARTDLPVTDLTRPSLKARAATADDRPEILTESDCLALLRSREIGRIAFELAGQIEIFPVNFGMEGLIIVFRTASGTKLAAAPLGAVTFEVDSYDAESGIGWSVVAKGRTEEVTTTTGRVAGHLRQVPVHPAAPGDRWHWMAIKPSEITGRRFRRAPTPPARA